MDILKFFSYEKITDHVYVVTEHSSASHSVTIGVLLGVESVLVINSGLGTSGTLRKYIESLVGTDKIIECLCTNGRPDHVGGAALFDEAYLNTKNYSAFKDSFNKEQRLKVLDEFSLHNNEIIECGKELMSDNSKVSFLEIADGDDFHLGGVRVDILALPAYSEGSVAAVSKKDKVAFCGDGINKILELTRLDRDGLLSYRDALNKFISHVFEDTIIYSSSSSIPMTIQTAKDIVIACEEVAAGNVYGDLPSGAESEDYDRRLHFVNNTCILYDAALLK